jgi:hypothetical protein
MNVSKQQSDPHDDDRPVDKSGRPKRVPKPTGKPPGRPRTATAAGKSKDREFHAKDEELSVKDELRANVLQAIQAYIDSHEGMTALDFCNQFKLTKNAISVWRRGYYAIRDWEKKGDLEKGDRPFVDNEKWPGFHHCLKLAGPMGLTLDELCLGRLAGSQAGQATRQEDDADDRTRPAVNSGENVRLRHEVGTLREQNGQLREENTRLREDLESAGHADRVSEQDRGILATVRRFRLDEPSLKDVLIDWLVSQNRNLANQ